MRKLALFGATLAMLAPAWADDDSVTQRLFVAATELEKSGQVEPARRAYRQVVDGAPESPWADDALLALARLQWPVDDPAQLGEVPAAPETLARAQQLLEAVVGRYVASDSAAEASWRLGLLLLEPSYAGRSPDEAVARLVSLPTVYPDSPFAPRALALAASVDARGGRAERARASAFDLLARWPSSPEGVRAWLVLGRVFAEGGQWSDALFAFGRAQALAGAASPEGAEAARLATLVNRFAFRVDAPGAALAPTPEGLVTGAERVASLAAGAGGRLALLHEREGACEIVEPDGTRSRVAAPDAQALAFDRAGGLWIAGSLIASPRGAASFATEAGLEIVGIAPVDLSLAWVVDERERRVILLRRDGSVAREAELPDRARPAAIASDGRGGAWILDARAGLLHRVDPDGRLLTRIVLASRVERAADLAVDPLGHVYVLDERGLRVQVFAPTGVPLFGVDLPGEGALAFERPEALAVDDAGGVAVYDERRERIVWLR